MSQLKEDGIHVTIEVQNSDIPVEFKCFPDEIAVLDYCRLLALEKKKKVRFSVDGRYGVILEPPVINA